MRNRTLMAVFVAVAAGMVWAAPQAAEKQTCRWWKIAFDTSVAFAAPRQSGPDAAVLVYPAGAELGKGRMEITLAALPKDMIEGMGLKDDEILGFVKMTYLGAGPTQESAERIFFGKTVKGDRQTTSIPRAANLEAYLVPLPDGDRLGIVFVSDPALPSDEAEKIIAEAARTLRLDSPA